MSQRSFAIFLLIAGIVALCMILAMLCILSFPWSSPMVGFVIIGFVMLFAGGSGSISINSASLPVKQKRSNILLTSTIIGAGIFLWGVLMSNYIVIIISYLPLVIATTASISLLLQIKPEHSMSELSTSLPSSAARLRRLRNRRKRGSVYIDWQ